ncbi:Formyltransferase [Lentinus tigrinus ALCF2SS1-7]|uniref:Formyltransferase n=1 Tax=Lentinus tigrinus ALCF2SS1-7 TaxID=1328758 RepID=UPI001165DBD0|nr:Formyltransferase [Lentinus tigrinus ALCF2SS1-7]
MNRIARLYSSTTDPFKVLFFGRDEFSCLVLKEVLAAKDVWKSIQVVTQPDTKTGRRGSQLSISPLKLLAEEANVDVHTIPHVRSAFRTWKAPPPFSSEVLSNASGMPPPEHLLVTASFGRILSNSLLGMFLPSRRLNVHPSLLPAYRGAAPIQHALMDGQNETGVCVIEMTEWKKGIDSGAIWASERTLIPQNVTFPALRDTLARTGGQLLVSVMRDMLAGKDTRAAQIDDPNAPRAPLITADHSMVNFETMTASRIAMIYRAISHQKPVAAVLNNGRTLQLHNPSVLVDQPADLEKALPVEGTGIFYPPERTLIIRCAEGTYLSVPEVRQQDRHLLKAKEWWNGVKPEMRLHGAPEGPVHFLPPTSMTTH